MECSYGCLSNFDLPPPESPSGRNKLTVPYAWLLATGVGGLLGAIVGEETNEEMCGDTLSS